LHLLHEPQGSESFVGPWASVKCSVCGQVRFKVDALCLPGSQHDYNNCFVWLPSIDVWKSNVEDHRDGFHNYGQLYVECYYYPVYLWVWWYLPCDFLWSHCGHDYNLLGYIHCFTDGGTDYRLDRLWYSRVEFKQDDAHSYSKGKNENISSYSVVISIQLQIINGERSYESQKD
jgi:hypothetical protein